MAAGCELPGQQLAKQSVCVGGCGCSLEVVEIKARPAIQVPEKGGAAYEWHPVNTQTFASEVVMAASGGREGREGGRVMQCVAP